MDRHLLAALCVIGTTGVSSACDCAMELPGTLCETMDPAWAEPDIVVLGVKLDEIYYGMHVRVLQVFDGNVVEGDTITVWGDNGALCRWYVGNWATGDTVVWALNNTDFLGNEITAGYPPDLEQAGDFHISACGTYWLDYVNGNVVGGIVPGTTSLPLEEFWPAVSACLSTGIEDVPGLTSITVGNSAEGVRLSLKEPGIVRLVVSDANGRTVVDRAWSGESILLDRLAPGAYTALVTGDDQRWTTRFVTGATTR